MSRLTLDVAAGWYMPPRQAPRIATIVNDYPANIVMLQISPEDAAKRLTAEITRCYKRPGDRRSTPQA